jgi:hypothetical protein
MADNNADVASVDKKCENVVNTTLIGFMSIAKSVSFCHQMSFKKSLFE